MRIRISLVCLCSFLLLTAATFAEPFNLDSLLIESVGGPKAVERIESMKSFRATGKLSWNGMAGDYSAIYMAPNKFKVSADFGEFSIEQGYDGTHPWQKDIHGRVFNLSGFERTEFMRNVYVMSFAYLPRKGKQSQCWYAQIVPTDSVNFHEVACSPEPGDTISILLREDLAIPSIYGAYLDNIMLVTVLAEFEKVEGILIPFYSYTSSPQAPIFTELVLDTFEIDAAIDSTIFTKPNPILTDFHFPPDSISVSIPFENKNGHITIAVQVNGSKKGRFILDTGASASYYHTEFVTDMELSALGEIPAMGLGGFENMQLVRFDSLTIGNLSLYDQTAGVMPLYELELQSLDDTPFGGILGYDFFVRFPMQFDFKDQTLKVFNPKKFTAPKNGISIPFQLTMMIPTIKANTGEYSGDFLVDLGNAFGLIIHQSFAEKLISSGAIDLGNGSNRNLGGIGQGVAGQDVEISEFKIAGQNLKIPEAILVEPSQGLTGSRLIAGNIGTKVLEQYSVLFDYQNQMMIIYGL